MNYYRQVLDDSLYRRNREGEVFELYFAGAWHPADGPQTPSQEDLDHLEPISEADAKRLIAARR